jgi:hypothetical protein
MVARVSTVAFEGVEARPVDVQVHIAAGAVAFTVVGLGDKAVAESRERVRSALIASSLALPAKRITVNLAPADMPKEAWTWGPNEAKTSIYVRYLARQMRRRVRAVQADSKHAIGRTLAIGSQIVANCCRP